MRTAVKNREQDSVNTAKEKAVNRLKTYAQTGSGKRSLKQSAKASPTRNSLTKRKTAKRRKESFSTVRSNLTKKQKTTPEDVFGEA